VTLLTGIIPNFAATAPALTVGCALYIVGLVVPGARSVATLAVCLVAMSAAVLVTMLDTTSATVGIGFVGLTVGAPWLLGSMLRERRAAAAHATAQAVSEERLRIARELHDIVAHSMSLIAVKAAIANHVADARPEETRDALKVIEATSRGALQQLRQAVGTLRDDQPYAPAPGLADLPALAQQAASGGVDVQLDVRGDADVPATVGLSAYRIVQEALTNVVKHAAPARCQVAVSIADSCVLVKVTDDGRRPVAAAPGGHGLIGIRERAAMYGGEFSAGPRAEGGFELSVRLPFGPAA
jgi:signal transduction histidine kinase